MAINIPNGGMSVRKAVGFEGLGFSGAEGVSMVTSLGVVAVMDKLIPEPIMNAVTHTVSKICIEPFLDNIEKAMGACKLEECKVDKEKPREERAERIAKIITVFGTAWVASMYAKLATRRCLNKMMGVGDSGHKVAQEGMGFFRRKLHDANPMNWSQEERMIVGADEGVHLALGGLLLFNDKVAHIADEQIGVVSNIFQKMGFSKQKSDAISNMAVVWELPNVAGVAAGLAAIFGKHAYNLPRLSELKHSSIKDILSGVAKSEHSIAGH